MLYLKSMSHLSLWLEWKERYQLSMDGLETKHLESKRARRSIGIREHKIMHFNGLQSLVLSKMFEICYLL